jgi:hypothetical protein
MQSNNNRNMEGKYNYMELARVLYKIFLVEGRYNIEEVSDVIGRSVSWFYKVCERKISPSYEDVMRILRYTRDIEIAQTIVGKDFEVLQKTDDRFVAGWDACKRQIIQKIGDIDGVA